MLHPWHFIQNANLSEYEEFFCHHGEENMCDLLKEIHQMNGCELIDLNGYDNPSMTIEYRIN